MADVPPSTPTGRRITASQSVLLHNKSLREASNYVLNSPNPRARDIEINRQKRDQLQALQVSKTGEYSEPPQLPSPPIWTLESDSDPENPIQTQSQLDLLRSFTFEGRVGLQKEIYRQAETQKILENQGGYSSLRNDSSWERILDDKKFVRNHVYHVLMTLPDKVIVSLVKNTMAHDALHDREVRDFVKSRLAWDGPAIYAECPSLGGKLLSPVRNSHHWGRWLSKNQIEELLCEVEKYIEDGPADKQSNIRIDEYFKVGWKDRSKRRYCTNSRTKAKIKTWIMRTREQFCTRVDPVKDDIPFLRCPMEIGWAIDVRARLGQHVRNGPKTSISGLVNVLTRTLFNFPQTQQFVIFPIWEPDHMPQVAELTATILCNAYWYDGGLNHRPAGGFQPQAITKENKPRWERSAQRAVAVSKQNQTIDLAQHLERAIAVAATGPAKIDELRKRYEKAEKAESDAIRTFNQLRLDRANRRLRESQQVREHNDPPSQAAEDDPLLKLMKDMSVDAAKQAEIDDRVDERIKNPRLSDDSQFNDLVEERLSKCRAMVQQRMSRRKSVDVDSDTDTEPPPPFPPFADSDDDDSIGDDIQQVIAVNPDDDGWDPEGDDEEEDGEEEDGREEEGHEEEGQEEGGQEEGSDA